MSLHRQRGNKDSPFSTPAPPWRTPIPCSLLFKMLQRRTSRKSWEMWRSIPPKLLPRRHVRKTRDPVKRSPLTLHLEVDCSFWIVLKVGSFFVDKTPPHWILPTAKPKPKGVAWNADHGESEGRGPFPGCQWALQKARGAWIDADDDATTPTKMTSDHFWLSKPNRFCIIIVHLGDAILAKTFFVCKFLFTICLFTRSPVSQQARVLSEIGQWWSRWREGTLRVKGWTCYSDRDLPTAGSGPGHERR